MDKDFYLKNQRTQRYFTTITQFQFLENTTIGKGSFGTVVLALYLRTSKIYAIKIINLNQITTEIGRKALERETSIHSILDHPHIVKLWDMFQQENKLYMVMEYVQNGNLFYYQNIKRSFPQAEASIFFAQTLSAIEYLHGNNYMHRDLKPENLLLDRDYNIKICDFGWVVQDIQEKRKIFCGTYQYMAPQMIFDQDYDYRIDIWALGVLLYELLHGFAPFEGETVAEVRKQMLRGQIQLDPRLSEQAQDLIYSILKLNPEQRPSLSQIKQHKWIKLNQKIKMQNLRSLYHTSTKLTKKTTESQNNKKSSNQDNTQNSKHSEQTKNIHYKKFDKKISATNESLQEIHKTFEKLHLKENKDNHQQKISRQKLSKDNMRYNKENQILNQQQKTQNRLKKSQNGYSSQKKKSMKNLYEFPNKVGHRPQNSDITSYQNHHGKPKKQSRLKTDQSTGQLHSNLNKKYYISNTKSITRFQTQIHDCSNIVKKREKNPYKAGKYKKNVINNNKTLQFSKYELQKQKSPNPSKTDNLALKYLRKSID